ncbi:DUF1127 domain-containing protein [Pseudomonas yamanorum]|uniref:DUF1127 domain-containing protein n=1 Tax=Pseudomonas yamanorum TaxID=515393 RepID=A0A7Y8EIW0_9PSED|nr:DUF1127 domain-containing protein [Pseudomonas yamanorum]NVZ80185.1 DUF1127 domain-containing protein [Pseudomonas yamanorum]NWE15489.1 DUF1127 domain-containing protein [Pseudomonas yamanorum]NWE40457.1 DUF1127 domain-containing protein [Pseudomonas yamanorum]NWE73921.1 DUF1127 domain-containing protein [Pseudomonas yamanorum]
MKTQAQHRPLLIRLLRRTALALARWEQRARTRRLLAQLDPRELSDAGISHGDRVAELSKWFWNE